MPVLITLTGLSCIIIYMKNVLASDWLREMQF